MQKPSPITWKTNLIPSSKTAHLFPEQNKAYPPKCLYILGIITQYREENLENFAGDKCWKISSVKHGILEMLARSFPNSLHNHNQQGSLL